MLYGIASQKYRFQLKKLWQVYARTHMHTHAHTHTHAVLHLLKTLRNLDAGCQKKSYIIPTCNLNYPFLSSIYMCICRHTSTHLGDDPDGSLGWPHVLGSLLLHQHLTVEQQRWTRLQQTPVVYNPVICGSGTKLSITTK